MKKLLWLLLFPLSAFANQDNVLTWDDCAAAHTAAECASVLSVEIEFKREACSVVPDTALWQFVTTVPVAVVTYTHANQPSGDYCYAAYYLDTRGRGPVSNLAAKSIPLTIAPANLR